MNDRRVFTAAAAAIVRHTAAVGAVALVLLVLAPRGLVAQARTKADSALVDSVRRARQALQLAPVVVTGTRLSTADVRLANAVDVVDVQQVVITPAAAITSLTQLPGVTWYDDMGARLQPELEVRGFTVSPIVGSPQGLSVFLDGVRVNEPDAQEVNFDLLPMAAVANESVVRGPAVLFGRNSLGGTILLTTRRGTETPEVEAELGVGSFGERTGTLTVGRMFGGFDAFVAASASGETGWRDSTSSTTRNVFASLGRQWGHARDSGDVVLHLSYAHDYIGQAGSLPNDYAALLPRTNYSPEHFSPDLLSASVESRSVLAGGLLRGMLFTRRNNYNQFNGIIPPPNSDAVVQNLSGGGTLEWTRPISIGGTRLALTLGTDLQRDYVHVRQTNVGGGLPDSLTTLAAVLQDNGAAYAQAVATLGSATTLTGGVRADYVRIPYRDLLTPANDGTSTYDRLSPQLGVSYQVTDNTHVYVSYKSGFRAPAPLELACASAQAPCSLPSALGGDPPLRPVTSNDYESGIGVQLPHRSHLDVDAFWTDVANDIQFASPDLTHVYFLNVAHTRRAGVETSAEVAVPSVTGLRVFGSYAYVAATYQSTVQIATADTQPRPSRPGDVFPSSPLFSWRGGASIGHLLGNAVVSGEADLHGYSSQFLRGDESNQRAPLPGYALAGVRGGLELGRYTVKLEISNLLDRRYYSFGVLSRSYLAPIGGTGASSNPPVVPFLTPGFPRRIELAWGARL